MGQRGWRLITAAGATLAASAALVSAGGPARANVSPAASAAKKPFLAGYHFSVSKRSTALTVKGSIKVPTISCGSGNHVFVPQVVAHYYVGHNLDTASAQLGLGCISGLPGYGDPTLLVGTRTVNVPHQVRPGETVAITIAITTSKASVKVAYATTATDSGAGGRPSDAQYSVGLPAPPRYSAVRFSGCTANGKSLASYHPGEWIAVNRSGKVIGTPSKITGGGTFSVTE